MRRKNTRGPGHGGDAPGYDDEQAMVTDEDHEHAAGGGSLWSSIMRMASIRPVQGDPSMDPAPAMHRVSEMAGWSGAGGHDALQGVDKLVTGEVDANRELETPSATEGTPLQLAPDESVFSDDLGLGTHRAAASRDRGDWCADLRLRGDE
jgi:hypothetical protein